MIGMPSSSARVPHGDERNTVTRQILCDDGGIRTSVQGGDEAPISCVHHVAVAVPAFSPFYAERVVRAVEVRPETEIERRDEEDPVEGRACARVGRVVGFRRAEVERVRVPRPWVITVFDEPVSYLWRSDQ